MSLDKEIILTTAELIGTLELCGFHTVSKNLRKEYSIKDTSLSSKAIENLKQKGYWNSRRKTKLTIELQEMLEGLANSSKELVCKNNKQTLVFHQYKPNQTLIQFISEDEHTFSYHSIQSDFVNIVSRFYGIQSSAQNDLDPVHPIEVTDKVFDSLHTLNTREIDKMMQDPKLHTQLAGFLEDFQNNSRGFHSLSFLEESNSKKSKTDQIAYFLTNKDFIWHVDYEQINNHKIYFVPVSFSAYFSKIKDTLREFFSQPSRVAASKDKMAADLKGEDKKSFSVKRGLSFLLKSNIVLTLMILIFFMNRNLWSSDGSISVTAYWMVFEILIVILSFAACLRPKEI